MKQGSSSSFCVARKLRYPGLPLYIPSPVIISEWLLRKSVPVPPESLQALNELDNA